MKFLIIQGDIPERMHTDEYNREELLATNVGQVFYDTILNFISNSHVGSYIVLGMSFYVLVRIA